MRLVVQLGLALPAVATVFLKETFPDGWEERWTASHWKGEDLHGKVEHTAGEVFADEKKNRGLKTAEDHRYYAYIRELDEPFSSEDKEVIFQYQLKYEKSMDCGGGYLKFAPKMENLSAFNSDSVYNIMFGPDKCGFNSRTHLIFNNSKDNILKTEDLPYKQQDTLSHVYRLVLRPNDTVRVEIDGDEVFDGSIEENWQFTEPKEIDDPEDSKPDDWVDTPMMDDPEDKKPEDWVEEAKIPDEKATQPEDWDEEEDGEWERPMIDNPDYKGPWMPKQIANPDYKGEWKPKKIPNPKYVAVEKMHKFDFGTVALDVWQVNSGAIFDNIIITDDPKEADVLIEEFKELRAVEEAKAKEEKEKQAAEKKEDEAAEESVEDEEDESDEKKDDVTEEDL
ncbi:Calreticulin precursor, putative [Perkinsus marinus ATCC 50983]|uniref:Calreticulin, putative n=1 Tax=Perkinsus marinus (strain ATCC 50983 / TXsc) TaxID=423536 RepID=C5LZP6_PERM5|nr:Calreticulin precursor, putative [Perkinsus marinus ATCC 50983]EEQ97714.1 Calreticulin precursor, putative [Perkinsus marinus ATCC 50983]|eukprot:XP_002764997.1 Calreticulin precursor, putative [Perkinsus marinus ATCC 50983]